MIKMVTVDAAIMASIVIMVLTQWIQSYRRYKDRTKGNIKDVEQETLDEIEALEQEITELEKYIEEMEKENENMRNTIREMSNYLFGYHQDEEDQGVLQGVQMSLEEIQMEMEEEHTRMDKKVNKISNSLIELTDLLHKLSNVDQFDRDDIRDHKWRSDD